MKTIQYEMTRTVHYTGQLEVPDNWEYFSEPEKLDYLSRIAWEDDEDWSQLIELEFSDA